MVLAGELVTATKFPFLSPSAVSSPFRERRRGRPAPPWAGRGFHAMARNFDLRLQVGALDHPKALQPLEKLGPGGLLCWIRLLEQTAGHRPDGSWPVSASTLGLSIRARDYLPGIDPLDVVGTLVDLGLLDGTESAYEVHDWAGWNPWAVR